MFFTKKSSIIGTLVALFFMLFATAALGQTTTLQGGKFTLAKDADGNYLLVEKYNDFESLIQDTLVVDGEGYTGKDYKISLENGALVLTDKYGGFEAVMVSPGATAAAPATKTDDAAAGKRTVEDVVETFHNPFQNHRTQSGGDASRSRQGRTANTASDTTSKSGTKFVTFLKENVGVEAYYLPTVDYQKLAVSRRLQNNFDIRLTLELTDWLELQAGPSFTTASKNIMARAMLFDGVFGVSTGYDILNQSRLTGFNFGMPAGKKFTFGTDFLFGKAAPVPNPTAQNPFGTVQPGLVLIQPYLGWSLGKKLGHTTYVGLRFDIKAVGATEMRTAEWGFYPHAMVKTDLTWKQVRDVISRF